MLHFLVSNDDGIEAAGIRALVRALAARGEVSVYAPAGQQSGKSQALTLDRPLRAESRVMEGAARAYAIDGTPADCVKFGIQHLRKEGCDPDYVITGINMGYNIGMDVLYSGTVAGATEGALAGYPSIALSVGAKDAANFDYLLDCIPELLEQAKTLPAGVMLNVNAPDLPRFEMKGMKIVGCGGLGFDDSFLPHEEEEDAYQYSSDLREQEEAEEEVDRMAVADGYATVTPLRADRVAYDVLAELRQLTDARPVIVFTDVQEDVMNALPRLARARERILSLALAARALEIPVLVTEQYGERRGRLWGELQAALHEYDKMEKLVKLEFDMTEAPAFEKKMNCYPKEKMFLLAGTEAHTSVLLTAEGLRAKGYPVTVFTDCIASREEEDAETAKRAMRELGCRMETSETYLYRLAKSTATAECRALDEIYAPPAE